MSKQEMEPTVFMVVPWDVLRLSGGPKAEELSQLQSELSQTAVRDLGAEVWMLEAAIQAAGAGVEGMWHSGGADMAQLVWYR